MTEIDIRTAGPDEADAILAAWDWLFAPPGSTPPRWDPAVAVERLRRLAAGERSALLVAEIAGDLAGVCTVALDIESVRFGQRAWVEDLMVAPDRRSLGVGKRLLDAAKDWGRARGASHLELDSGDARADAHRFYERERPSWSSRSFGWEL